MRSLPDRRHRRPRKIADSLDDIKNQGGRQADSLDGITLRIEAGDPGDPILNTQLLTVPYSCTVQHTSCRSA